MRGSRDGEFGDVSEEEDGRKGGVICRTGVEDGRCRR
jgi:hypothetical protein